MAQSYAEDFTGTVSSNIFGKLTGEAIAQTDTTTSTLTSGDWDELIKKKEIKH